MSKHAAKQERELAIFKRFIAATNFPVTTDSIQNCEVPKPDIRCEVAGEGPVWFEIAETCSQDVARAFNTPPEDGVFVGWVGENTEETVAKKVSKSYESDGPIELLMYDDGRTPKTDQMLIDSIDYVLKSGTGAFRRVWFFGKSGVHQVWSNVS